MTPQIPTDFPYSEYDAIRPLVWSFDEATRPDKQQPTTNVRLWAIAHNAVLWRYQALADADAAYQAAYALTDVPGDIKKRYLIEKSLFEFFATFIATAESLSYSTYIIGAMAKPSSFECSEHALKNLTPDRVKGAFSAAFQRDEADLVAAFKRLNETCQKPYEVRNMLSHHGSPPWRHFVYLGSATEKDRTEWGALTVDATVTARLRPDLSRSISEVVQKLLDFVTRRLTVA